MTKTTREATILGLKTVSSHISIYLFIFIETYTALSSNLIAKLFIHTNPISFSVALRNTCVDTLIPYVHFLFGSLMIK